MNVPFLDLQAQYAPIKEEIRTAIDRVLDTSSYILGPSVEAFEEAFGAYVGCEHALGVNSGTSALHLALLALGVGPGDEVLVPAMTFIATASAVDYCGATPVPVDVHPETMTMDPAGLEAALTERTKVVMPVHLYGRAADMEPILAFAKAHGLRVVEDAAQSHGATWQGRPCGSIGDIAGFSFYPGKNLGAYGEGGAVVTNDPELAEIVRCYRDWGQRDKGEHVRKGYNYRMDGIQGAVLGVKLGHLDAWTEGRQAAAARYHAGLGDHAAVQLASAPGADRHVHHVFPVLHLERDRVRAALHDAGIASGIHYPRAIHQHPCFADLGHAEGAFPVAERIARDEFSLPMFPELTEAQTDRVIEAVRAATE